LTRAHGGTNRENATNEANCHDDVKISQIQEIVDVTADSGDGSGLDKLRTKPKFGDHGDGDGRRNPKLETRNSNLEIGGFESQSAVLVSGSPGDGALTPDLWACALLRGTSAGASDQRRDALPEMERMLLKEIENLASQGQPVGELLKEIEAASIDLHAQAEQFHSRAP
jgi:hypothetical protein